MTNEQIILNEAAKLDPATLHAIATAHHTPEQIAAIAAKATTTDDDGNEKPASVADVEAVLAADVDHCAIGQERLVCRHGHARLNRLAAGRDPGSSAANVRPFLGAVGSAFENPGILDI